MLINYLIKKKSDQWVWRSLDKNPQTYSNLFPRVYFKLQGFFTKDRITYLLSIIAIIALLITSYATIENTKKIYFLSEKETHPNLIISFVNSELSYSNSSNGIFDILTIQPTIEVYNTKRSDYPARILSVKSKIFDDKTGQVIVDTNRSRIIGRGYDRIVEGGESVEFYTEVEMNLIKTGNYTTQTTIEYQDLKDYSLQSIDFYNEFEIKEESFENEIILYRARPKEIGDFNEFWAIGKKYD